MLQTVILLHIILALSCFIIGMALPLWAGLPLSVIFGWMTGRALSIWWIYETRDRR